jgi:hypothetical protein
MGSVEGPAPVACSCSVCDTPRPAACADGFLRNARVTAAPGRGPVRAFSVAGNAAQKANRTLPQIEKILAEASAADAAEDAREASSPQPATPQALARRAERRERLARARDRLAEEDKARRQAQRAKQEAREAAAAAGKRRGHRPGDEPRANRAGTGPRADITDPDVRVMRNQKGYAAGYNGQAAVTADQVIAGAMLSQHPVDRTLLHPLLDQCRDQLAAAGIRPELRTVLADSGYVSEENLARADQDRLRLLAPLAKAPDRRQSRPPKRARHLEQYPATARAIRRMRHPRGQEDHKLRARTAEPVSGQLKTCQELTMMSRRGFTACESEWLLACTARNLRKLHRHRQQG